jgi:YfiH family protein
VITVDPPFRSEALGIRLTVGHAEFLLTNAGAGDFAAPNEQQRAAVSIESGIEPSYWAQDDQIHGTKVTIVAAGGEPTPFTDPADGQATDRDDILCAVRTADCLAVLLAGDRAVAAVHAGWRGLSGGVVSNGVKAMQTLGAAPTVAVIGPGARGCCYEVGDETIDAFASYPSAFTRERKLDLATVAREQLLAAGVGTVYDCGICTICSSSDDFFSYRRDHGQTGRMLGAVWLS